VSDKQRGAGGPVTRHILFDADGVLQELPGGWVAAAEPYFGERALEFLERSYQARLPSLALVRALRVSGYGVHLGTNQERYRAVHMREVHDLGCTQTQGPGNERHVQIDTLGTSRDAWARSH
jgi:hypothetical protein